MGSNDHPSPDQVALADRLAEARRRARLSQQQVADKTGIPRSAISDIEHGQRRVDSLELKALATAYNEDVARLLGDGPPWSAPSDPLTRLEKVTQDVYGYLDQRAREIAKPFIAATAEAAANRVSQVEHDLRMSRDLVAELRRQCAALVKQVERRPAPVSERTEPA